MVGVGEVPADLGAQVLSCAGCRGLLLQFTELVVGEVVDPRGPVPELGFPFGVQLLVVLSELFQSAH